MSAAQDLPRGPRDLAGGALPAVGPATRGDGSRRQPGHPHIVTRRPTCCSVEIWVMRDTKPDSKPTQSQPASSESGSLCRVLLVLSFWCHIHGPEQARPPPVSPPHPEQERLHLPWVCGKRGSFCPKSLARIDFRPRTAVWLGGRRRGTQDVGVSAGPSPANPVRETRGEGFLRKSPCPRLTGTALTPARRSRTPARPPPRPPALPRGPHPAGRPRASF